MNYLTDFSFLCELAKHKQKITYARITALSFDESPIEKIEGKVTSGSINVDGGSAMRRTCSLSLISEGVNINNFVWTLNTKFKLEIGVYNFVNQTDYPEILWFPQGVYAITSFSTSISTSSISISISGKDKMAFLNGEISGHFGQTTILDSIEEWDEQLQAFRKRKYELKFVIKDLVYTLGNEKLENIYINDLDENSLKMLKYIGQSKLYIKQKVDSSDWKPVEGIKGYTIISSDLEALKVNEEWEIGTIPNLEDFLEFSIGDTSSELGFSAFGNNDIVNRQPLFYSNEEHFLLYQLSYGDIAGYEATPMVFNDDLIAQPGETITAMLDKITAMLGGSYEYFYDLYGHFIFQKKKTYLDTSWSPLSFYLDGDTYTVNQNEEEYVFEFTNNELISSISINPGIDKVKNDFIVYGQTKNKHPIHLRYVIDKKPERYVTWDWRTYLASNEAIGDNTGRPDKDGKINGESAGSYVNWEANNDSSNLPTVSQKIYKTKSQTFFSMATYNFKKVNDNIKLGPDDGKKQELLRVGRYLKLGDSVHKIIGIENTGLGTRKRILLDDPHNNLKTGRYEVLYYDANEKANNIISDATVEFYVDWRELLYQMAKDFHAHGQDSDYIYQMRLRNPELFAKGKTGYEQYYTDIMGFWPDLYRYKTKVMDESLGYEVESEVVGWNLERLADPTSMLYWLEFIEGNSQFEAISVPNIGDRTKVASNKKSTVLFEPNVPPLLFYTSELVPATTLTYSPIKLSEDLQTAFSLASFPTAAKTVMDDELNNFTSFTRSLNLTSVPIYSLDVNRKIKISTDKVRGQFLINRLTIPLNYNGMMSINLSEITDSLF